MSIRGASVRFGNSSIAEAGGNSIRRSMSKIIPGLGIITPNEVRWNDGGEPAVEDKGGSKEEVQEQEITLKIGGKDVKVKTSDILDERGVPYKQTAGELNRKLEEATTTLQEITQRGAGESGSESEEVVEDKGGNKKGPFIDPVDGKSYTEDDLNRFMMTGEGVKALRIVMNPRQVRAVVDSSINAREIKAATRTRYPDLNNSKSEFFMRTAIHMQKNNLFDHPQGLALAAAAVAEDMRSENKPFTTGTTGNSEHQRKSQGGHTIPGRDGTGAPSTTEHELDDSAKEMALKLGVDPKKMAKRLAEHLDRKNHRRQEED